MGNSYKEGTYKGLDIAFGHGDKNIYGGILIRSIEDIVTKKFVEGSCNCVTEMMSVLNVDKVTEFVKLLPDLYIENVESPLHLEIDDN